MGEIAKGRIPVRKKRSHADHLGAKVCQKFHVLRQRLGGLIGRADHHARARLVADVF